ncbi:c-type cytochrome biogenesis protein CcmI [Tropicimonas marinistellae]|uniref:c-type cytochrome biogenesis protein CcmI n=1 Tax=Tropicimonas marinistellae TaxID=1739787 RepID=UPI00082D23EB|nr:c-type cytochrome biogenesis protein CcmI [Tropicimonas marinistellae]
MLFWIISGLAALLAALLIGWPLMRPQNGGAQSVNDTDIQIYRDQLRSIDKDLARGVVSTDEADRLRTEIKRRILDADKARGDAIGRAPRGVTVAAAVIAGLAVIAGSYLVYDRIGAPGYADMPLKKRLADAEAAREARPSQAELEAAMPAAPQPDVDPEYAALIEKLRVAVEENPDELEGWVLLARNEAGLGNLPAAHVAQARVIELKGESATSQDYSTYAAMLVQAAGGRISAEADNAIAGALDRDPHSPLARYFAGLMHLQTDRPDLTFQFWEPLVGESPPDAPWMPIIRARLESVAALAGINYTLPASQVMPDPHGNPTADDIAAAADMSPEERQAFIQNMVDQLGQRMAEEGGPPSDWAKLIRAHGILGNTDRAAAIWAEAQQRFTDPETLAPIRDAAVRAGVESGGAEERGPTQADIDAAAEMAPEDRQEMIRAMVDQLGERLATEGGPPADWARLVRAHGVLGNTEQAAAIWTEAQQTFAERPELLETIRAAAVDAGVAE